MVKNFWKFSTTQLNAWLPPLLWALLIYILSDQGILPSMSEIVSDFIFKKCAHMTVYAVLYLLLYRATRISFHTVRPAYHWQIGLAITLLYAISDESHQMFVPGRYGTIRDIGYDMLGAGVALLRQHKYI